MEQSIVMLAVAVVMAVVGLAATGRSAQAADEPPVPPSWAAWAFELKPDNNRYDAVWTITIGGEDKRGDSVVLHRRPLHLDCTPVGEVKIRGDLIAFDGGHLECAFPDLIAAANEIIVELWGPKYKLRAGLECKCMPLIDPYAPYAEATVAFAGKEGLQPLFDHPSISFSLASSSGRTGNLFSFSNKESTARGKTSSGIAAYRSTYGCEKDLGSCRFEHFQNGRLIGEEKRPYQVSNFYTGAATVNIGKIGMGKERFYGTIERLIVDPGCRGN